VCRPDERATFHLPLCLGAFVVKTPVPLLKQDDQDLED